MLTKFKCIALLIWYIGVITSVVAIPEYGSEVWDNYLFCHLAILFKIVANLTTSVCDSEFG